MNGPPHHPEDHSVESRITRVETNVGALGKSLSNLENEVHQLASAVNAGMDRLHDRISAAQKPNYSTWAGFAGVLVVVAGMFLADDAREFQRLESQVVKNGDLIRSHAADGHPGSVIEQTRGNRRSMTRLEMHLRREMALIDVAQREKIGGLESRLRRLEDQLERVPEPSAVRTEPSGRGH